MISGFAHLWLIDCASVPAPTVLHGQTIGPPPPPRKPEKESEAEAEAARWFQGHLLTTSAGNQQQKQQYSVLGVPSMQKPEIHSCMIGEHSKPAFYDIYFCQSDKETASIAFSALGVERHCGSGDAMELEFPAPSAVGEGGGGGGGGQPSVSASASLSLSSLERLRFSTTRMIAGERARTHLEKYAPAALLLYNHQRSSPSSADSSAASDNAIVCLGAMMLVNR
ncbi:hypothetical protein IWW48_005509 [Coemansia sp. RSA 1200]|nr:hypothetical protein IWW48_005509 [Coemansia sp. RSA 1200]